MAAPRRRSPIRDVSSDLAHCSTERRLELISQAGFFSHLDPADKQKVNELFREVHFAKGEWVYHPGDPALDLFIVAAGQVRLVQTGPGGREVLFELAASGDLVGGAAVIAGSSYQDGAQAQTECCLLRIAAADFQALLADLPGIALKVLEFAGSQLEQARSTIEGLAVASAEQRLARTILRLADRHGEEGAEGLLIQLPLPQQDLAAMTGTTVETVSRVLAQFRKAGSVTGGRGWLAVTDVAALEDVAYAGV